MPTLRVSPPIAGADAQLESLVTERIASRIFARDASLWGAAAAAEAAVRLGWTDFADAALAAIERAESVRAELATNGVDRFVLCGMGGSSLAPAVICAWADVDLAVLSSTHPGAVMRELSADLTRTAVIVSSKSGSTIETASHLAAFEAAFHAAGITPAERILVVTDPGSPLEERAHAAGYRVFSADPEVGGRFSALTAFGLVPACLAGADVRRLVADAAAAQSALSSDSLENPALLLAAGIAAGLPSRFALGLVSHPEAQWGLGLWIEQLVAESTGKDGHGVLPVVLDDGAPELISPPASMLRIGLHDGSSDTSNLDFGAEDVSVFGTLGAQFLLWETATAALGWIMQIDPFNQPDVESAKVAARLVLSERIAASGSEGVPLTDLPSAAVLCAVSEAQAVSTADGLAPGQESVAGVIAEIERIVPPGGYLAIQAYVDQQSPAAPALQALRDRLATRLGVPVALGWGPSYLHSSGQLHKGGPAIGAFVQICDEAVEPLDIPGSETGFDALFAAQSRGDRNVLAARGRPVIALGCEGVEPTVAALLAEFDA